MCGIVGYVGTRDAVPVILDGLRRLEYRGYDSAGIAVVSGGELLRRRAAGKLGNLAESLAREPLSGEWGVGHTRWATHGRPTEENAHPHQDGEGRVVVVHNGIVENHLELKSRLQAAGHRFVSQTDTEVVAHLVASHYRFYQAHANMLVAIMLTFGALMVTSADVRLHFIRNLAVLAVVATVLWLGSRDTLRKYYRRAEALMSEDVFPNEHDRLARRPTLQNAKTLGEKGPRKTGLKIEGPFR
jgi:glucosamine 6-phosphate synthetase-like amidotransferase/phosphosugar isomerase protein